MFGFVFWGKKNQPSNIKIIKGTILNDYLIRLN